MTPPTLSRRKRSMKRQTWPQSKPGHLETIVESPRAKLEPQFTCSEPTDSKLATQSTHEPLINSDASTANKDPSTDFSHTQMIWYSHHLTQSYHDRERLAGKIEQLEKVCKYQSSTNASLLKDVQRWRSSYECIESELVERTQEMEEAKNYVRSVETANANLRYALSQAKEERDQLRRKRTRAYLESLWRGTQSLVQRFSRATCGANVLKTTSPQPDNPSRVINIPQQSVSKVHLLKSRNCSRTSQLAPHALNSEKPVG